MKSNFGFLSGLHGRRKPLLAVGKDDVHRPQQQRIGQLPQIGGEPGEQRLADAKAPGEDPVAAYYVGGRLQQLYGSRAHNRYNVNRPLLDWRFWTFRGPDDPVEHVPEVF